MQRQMWKWVVVQPEVKSRCLRTKMVLGLSELAGVGVDLGERACMLAEAESESGVERD